MTVEHPIPPNQDNPMDENQNENESNTVSYLQLVGLSVLSALAILSLWIPFLKFFGNWGLGAILPFFVMLITQYILVAPATGLVILIHRKLSDTNKIHTTAQVLIPLVFNLLAANAYFIIVLAANVVGS